MKTPTKADFDVEVDDGGVHVLFRPTESYYDYLLLADGGLSRAPTVRHAKTGDTGDYARSKRWPMKWRRPTFDRGSSVHSLPACPPA
jgi:hypothetical protein